MKMPCECCGIEAREMDYRGRGNSVKESYVGMRMIGFQAIRLCRHCAEKLEKQGRCEH